MLPELALPKKVVILAEPSDIHARSVAKEIEVAYNSSAIILDVAEYPASWKLSVAFDSGGKLKYTIRTDTEEIESHQITGVWYRRIRPHAIPETVSDARVKRFCYDEARAAFQGWIYSLGHRVINQLIAELAANQKTFQLHKAVEDGWRVPKTLVTNDPKEARRFVEQQGNVIFKVLTGTSWQFTETRTLEQGHLNELDKLKLAPAIFQEKIYPKSDIRVTLIDDAIFPVSIHPHHPGAMLDWRLDLAAEIKQHALPREVAERIKTLVRTLGLRYAAIDLGLTPDGEYVFFEVNPAGQFLFCEIHTGQPISNSIAAALVGQQVPAKS